MEHHTVICPDIGDFGEVEVIEIMVKKGDNVAQDQSLVTVESDKASMEIPSSMPGVVEEVLVKLKDKISMGSPLIRIRNEKKKPATSAGVTNIHRVGSDGPTIFISYRREDSQDICGRIYDRLNMHFGRDRVFKDVDSIPIGVDFRKHLSQAVGNCSVLLAVIGRGWLEAKDDRGGAAYR